MAEDWELGDMGGIPKKFTSKNQMTDKQLQELMEKIDKEQKNYIIPLSQEEKIIYTDKNGKKIGVTIEKTERRKSKRKCRCK